MSPLIPPIIRTTAVTADPDLLVSLPTARSAPKRSTPKAGRSRPTSSAAGPQVAGEADPVPPWPDAVDPLLAFCRGNCVVRPIDWRWRLAFGLARAKRRKLPRGGEGDPALLRARDFARSVLRGKDPARADADVAAAWELSRGGAETRALLDAYLVGGLDDDAVADRTGLSPSVVAAYEAVFYAVRGAGAVYTAHAAGISSNPPADPAEMHAWALRTLAYTAGPKAVDVLVGFGGPVRSEASDLAARIGERQSLVLHVRACYAALLLPLETPRDLKRAMRLGEMLGRSERLGAEARRHSP